MPFPEVLQLLESGGTGGFGIASGGYIKAYWYQQVDSGTSGSLTLPYRAELLLDEFAAAGDAVLSAIENGTPNYKTPYTALGVPVTALLDSGGNWSLTGTPNTFPVAIIYAYRIPAWAYNASLTLLGGELTIAGAQNEDYLTNIQFFQDATYRYYSGVNSNGWKVNRYAKNNPAVKTVANVTNNPTQLTQPNSLITCQSLVYW